MGTRNKKTARQGEGDGVVASENNGHDELLPWWYDLVTSAASSPILDRSRAVYTNRSLRADKIRAVGFDFDHTLAVYNCAALDNIAMELVIDRLIEQEGYDRDFVEDLPEFDYARTGLIVDIEQGNVMKIDRYGHVHRAYHGTTRLTSDEKKELYSGRDIIPHVTFGDRFVQLDSPFAKPEVLIFAALAPRQKRGKCKKLWQTIRNHTDMIHRDGTLKQILMSRPLDFLSPDIETVAMLQKLRSEGKKVFLLTNSEWEYTRQMINPALGLGTDATDFDWTDLFDYVVTEGRKPDYFVARRGRDRAPKTTDQSKVVRGGNIHFLERKIGVKGNEVLYVGDHIYSDLITSKRRNHWRTMLIIPDLEDEMSAQALLPGMAAQLKQADERRMRAEREVRHWDAMEASLVRLDDPEHHTVLESIRAECAANREASRRALRQDIRLRERLRNRISDATNRYWGSLFRASNELTYYGKQVEDFACTYTSRATNLGQYPMDHYFRSQMDYLPHEVETM